MSMLLEITLNWDEFLVIISEPFDAVITVFF